MAKRVKDVPLPAPFGELPGAARYIGAALGERACGDFRIGHWIADRFGDEVHAHGHDDAHVMVVTGGRYVTTATGGRDAALMPAVYNPPGTWHRDRFVEGRGSFFTVTLPDADALGDFVLPPMPRQLAAPRTAGLLRRLMSACAMWDDAAALHAQALCTELVGTIARPSSPWRAEPHWLARARTSLRDAAFAGAGVAEASCVIGIHPVYLARAFRSFMRCTPGEFMHAQRLERATDLLCGTRWPLAEIALRCGFADQSHFTRRFRAAYGVSPGRYRRYLSRGTVAHR